MLSSIRSLGGQLSRLNKSYVRSFCSAELTDLMPGLEPDEISKAYQDEVLPTPPVKLYDSNGKRATYLWQLGVKANQLSNIERDLSTIANNLEQDINLSHFIQDLSITKKERLERIQKILEGMKASNITKDFFETLCETNKLRYFSKINDSFNELMKSHKKEIEVTVVSAKDLSSSDMENAKKVASQFMAADSKVSFKQRVDPQIIGGIILDMGDQYIDLSVRKKLSELEESVKRDHREIPVATIMGQVKKQLRSVL
eukprot:TRINITY_DN5073_c0_g2_i1.p1 TRINITY_DN5073_c0_g2~~TRINITY_DN5073_c0_g2_i1.p1  ORF type:complete len:284 (+),score=25.37 TRINITY_DN5073_c0_g2_i1:82-852(+)